MSFVHYLFLAIERRALDYATRGSRRQHAFQMPFFGSKSPCCPFRASLASKRLPDGSLVYLRMFSPSDDKKHHPSVHQPQATPLLAMLLSQLAGLCGFLLSSVIAQSTFRPARPPSIPLAVKNPYLSAWLPAGSNGGNGGYLVGERPTFWTYVE
jgi:hypothetical protein